MSKNCHEKSYVNDEAYRSYGTTETDNVPQKKKPEDLLQATVGNFGKWQLHISVLMALLKLPIAWFQLGIVFLAPATEFWCRPPEKYKSMAMQEWKELTTTRNMSSFHTTLESGSCTMSDILHPENNSTIPCQWGYAYNRTIVHTSIITEWDLVCGRERLVELAQVILMFGVLIGSIMFGVAADKFGRRRILILCIFLQSICGILSAVSPWYMLFMLFRFLSALANGGTMTTSFVMCMEIVGGPWRTIVPILYQVPFGLGSSSMAGIAYLLRGWREFQVTLSTLSALYMVYDYTRITKMASGGWQKKEAVQILEKAASKNGTDKSLILRLVEQVEYDNEDSNKGNSGITALFKTPELRKRTILLLINWLISGISFFGFSQYLGQLSHNVYFAVAVGGLISVPGTLLCVVVVKRCGRRLSIACSNCFTGLCFLLIIAIPRGYFYEDWPRIVFAGCGLVGLSISLPALYLFTAELYPTVLRNAGVGITVMCSKMGSMFAPLIITFGEIAWFIPLLLFGTLSLLEAVLVLPLPETLNTTLPETIHDVEDKKILTRIEDKKNGNYVSISTKASNEEDNVIS